MVPFASCAGYAIYSRMWSAQAEAAVRQSVSSQGTGQSVKGIVARVDRAAFPTDFPLPYEIIGPDNFSGRTSLMELLSPRVYIATLKFANGHEYEAEAVRTEDGVWQVTISLRP
jgi:hypothetical protein